MDNTELIAFVRAELQRLTQVLDLVAGNGTSPAKRAASKPSGNTTKKPMSAAARKKISEAQKKVWASGTRGQKGTRGKKGKAAAA